MTTDRRNITEPSDWWEAFEAAATASGMTLSAWMGDACVKQLPKTVAKKLSPRPPASRPKKERD